MEFKKLKGFEEFEASEKGSVRRVANKAMVVLQKEGADKGKVILTDSKNKEHAFSIEEVIKMRDPEGKSGTSEAPKKKGRTGTKIQEILELHKKGFSNKEIIEKGYHPTTVSIQVSKYKKANGTADKKEAPAKKAEAKKATPAKKK